MSTEEYTITAIDINDETATFTVSQIVHHMRRRRMVDTGDRHVVDITVPVAFLDHFDAKNREDAAMKVATAIGVHKDAIRALNVAKNQPYKGFRLMSGMIPGQIPDKSAMH